MLNPWNWLKQVMESAPRQKTENTGIWGPEEEEGVSQRKVILQLVDDNYQLGVFYKLI